MALARGRRGATAGVGGGSGSGAARAPIGPRNAPAGEGVRIKAGSGPAEPVREGPAPHRTAPHRPPDRNPGRAGGRDGAPAGAARGARPGRPGRPAPLGQAVRAAGHAAMPRRAARPLARPPQPVSVGRGAGGGMPSPACSTPFVAGRGGGVEWPSTGRQAGRLPAQRGRGRPAPGPGAAPSHSAGAPDVGIGASGRTGTCIYILPPCTVLICDGRLGRPCTAP